MFLFLNSLALKNFKNVNNDFDVISKSHQMENFEINLHASIWYGEQLSNLSFTNHDIIDILKTISVTR